MERRREGRERAGKDRWEDSDTETDEMEEVKIEKERQVLKINLKTD